MRNIVRKILKLIFTNSEMLDYLLYSKVVPLYLCYLPESQEKYYINKQMYKIKYVNINQINLEDGLDREILKEIENLCVCSINKGFSVSFTSTKLLISRTISGLKRIHIEARKGFDNFIIVIDDIRNKQSKTITVTGSDNAINTILLLGEDKVVKEVGYLLIT